MTDAAYHQLHQAWAALCAEVESLDPSIVGQLLALLGEPHRTYHGPAHVGAVLTNLGLLTETPTPQVRLAAFFHDAVYDPRRTDNEERSARLAEDLLGSTPSDVSGAVAALTRATGGHQLDETPDCALFLDADLAILGAPPGVYDRYAAAIRNEYQHIPEPAYRAGRAAVLEGFAARACLFFSDPGRQLWEEPARQNLARELAGLSR